MHIVVKKNGKLCITGNYKPILNPRFVINEHSIPKTNFNRIKDVNFFCHLDITNAYTHLLVDEKFRHA